MRQVSIYKSHEVNNQRGGSVKSGLKHGIVQNIQMMTEQALAARSQHFTLIQS